MWETTRHNRHNWTFARTNLVRICYGLVVYVADLLWICYEETGVMDFCLKRSFLPGCSCYLCCIYVSLYKHICVICELNDDGDDDDVK